MEVKTSVFDEEDGYISHDQVFRITNGSLETDRLFDFIAQAKKEHYGYYGLSADDVITITKQLKLLPKDANQDAVKLQYFDTMAEFMLLMRQKKNRNNRKLFKTYMRLVDFLWQNYSEEFLKYLDMTEEQFLNIQEDDDSICIIEEFISLDLFFAKINSYLVDNDKNNNSTDIYSKVEKEFGRTLSPVEYETINKWIEGNISIELIESALKEAILSGVNSIRYIDKILFEWNKKGYKTSSDIVSKKNNEEYIEEIYDYDWLNE